MSTTDDVNAALKQLQRDCDRLMRERDEARLVLDAMRHLHEDFFASQAALAASQAECERALSLLVLARDAMVPCLSEHGGAVALIEEFLSRPPGSREALLSYLNRCGVAAWDAGVGVADDASAYAQMSSRDLDEQRDIDVAAIVARLLREGGSHE